MMLPIYLCDDEPKWLSQLSKTIEQILMQDDFDAKIEYSSSSPFELLAYLEKSPRQTAIYILDVDLKSSMNGIQLASRIRNLDPIGYIIFITTHAEMAMKTFEYKVASLDYIVKDVGNIEQQIHSCMQHIQHVITKDASLGSLELTIEKSTFILSLKEFIYAEALKNVHKVRIYTPNGILETFTPLTKIEEKSNDFLFLCHRSYLINPIHVRKFSPVSRTLIMDNGDSCPCSLPKITSLRKRLLTDPLE